MNRLQLQITYGRALRGSLGHSAPETVAAWKRARQFAADINDPVELAPIHSGLFNACLTHGEIAPMRELVEAIMGVARQRPESPVAAVIAHWTNGVTCWFGGDYLNAQLHLGRALAIYEAEPNSTTFKASALDLPFVIMRFLALVLWPLGSIDRSRRLAAEAVHASGDKPALSRANALVHKAVFDGLCGGMLQETDTILALGLARDHTMPLYIAAGSYLNGLAKWRAGDRMGGLSEMQRGWTLLHENDCYLCEPFWGMQVAAANAEAGQPEAGLEILRELISSTERSGQHWLDAELYRSQGELLSHLDPPGVSMAEGAFRRALEIAEPNGQRRSSCAAQLDLRTSTVQMAEPRQYPRCSQQFLLISTRSEICPKSKKRKPCSGVDKWSGAATGDRSCQRVRIRAVSSWQSFRLAENTGKSAFSRALPLLTPCGMIAPKISKLQAM